MSVRIVTKPFLELKKKNHLLLRYPFKTHISLNIPNICRLMIDWCGAIDLLGSSFKCIQRSHSLFALDLRTIKQFSQPNLRTTNKSSSSSSFYLSILNLILRLFLEVYSKSALQSTSTWMYDMYDMIWQINLKLYWNCSDKDL